MISLLSYGEILVDFLPNSADASSYMPLAGGAPANVAVAFSKLGGESYFAGGLSTDNFGAMLMNKLSDEGVDTTYAKTIPDVNTALVLVSLDSSGERSFNFYRNNTADTKYSRAHIDEIQWQDIGVFHYCSNTLTNELMFSNTLYALDNAKANNVLISFDVNLRQQLWYDVTLLPYRVEKCVKKSDIIKLSKDEAEYLAKIKLLDVDGYINYLLSLGSKLIVMTDGPNAVQVTHENFKVLVEVAKISPVDTTGAGDSFISGLLFSLAQTVQKNLNIASLFECIEQREQVSVAVIFAAKCGAFTCLKKGAFTALPLLSDL